MGSPWNDLRRPPLRGVELARSLADDGWQVTVIEEVESTQDAVREQARAGAPAGTVVVAEFQRSGRGRRGRTWQAPPRAGLMISLLLRPPSPSPWLGIALSIAAAEAINEMSADAVRLKWPNDLIFHGRKVGGVIAEVDGDAVIVGIGINVTTDRHELPTESASSLLLEGLEVDRELLLKAILRRLSQVLLRTPSQLASDYRGHLETLGLHVRVIAVNEEIEGIAEAVDEDGRLVVAGRSFSVGDVIHLR